MIKELLPKGCGGRREVFFVKAAEGRACTKNTGAIGRRTSAAQCCRGESPKRFGIIFPPFSAKPNKHETKNFGDSRMHCIKFYELQ